MTSKQRAYLKSLAMNADTIMNIGKSSLTPEVCTAVSEALEKRELVKIGVLKNCLDDPKEIAAVMAERTHSQVVQVIGKKIVLYRERKIRKSFSRNKMADVRFEQFHTIAILGGTFNPVHAGHVAIAQAVLKARPEVDQLVCMPNHIPAYKEEAAIVDGSMRMDMLRLAMAQIPKISVSDFELKWDGYTYTVDTFTRLKKLYPKLTIEFVIGDDSLFQLHKWYEFERLANLCEILVVARGEQRDTIETYIRRFCTKYPAFHISYVAMPPVPVSSSEIRARIAKGESIQGLVPDDVLQYIEAHALYKQEAGRRQI